MAPLLECGKLELIDIFYINKQFQKFEHISYPSVYIKFDLFNEFTQKQIKLSEYDSFGTYFDVEFRLFLFGKINHISKSVM